jgi:aldehyde:ferredoxin oxidoreductase
MTGLLGYSTVGGHLGADIKFAGYDGVIIEGQASSPSYLYINDSNVEIRDAAHIWGKDTEIVWDILKDETGHKNVGIARIGIAGENLVKYACIVVDHFRAAGRTGMGAVMGSKKLKAIVVNGTDRKVPVAEPDALQKYTKQLNSDKKEDPTFTMYSDLGTAGFVDMASMMYGSLPAGYYTVSDFDSYNLSGTSVKESILVGKSACFRCPIGCGRKIAITDGKYATGVFAGPELEVTGTMGSLILNNNLEALAYVNKQLDLYGIDTISGGNTIALAYYLFNNGKIKAEDLDGLSPEWGEVDSALKLITKIAKREGVGDALAEGSLFFSKKHGVPELAVQVNGLETPMHDPRGFSGLAVGYATSPRGACHMAADMYNIQMGQVNESLDIESSDRFENEADLVARVQNLRCVTNSAVLCNFYPIQGDELVRLISLVTGWDFSIDELKELGERIFTLMRLLNLKLGYDPKREGLPKLLLEPLEGPTEGHVPDIDAHLNKWYKYRGWDRKSGKPSIKRVKAL